MKDKEIALFFLACSIFISLLSQYDPNLITKTIFVISWMLAGLYFAKIAFPSKEKKKIEIR